MGADDEAEPGDSGETEEAEPPGGESREQMETTGPKDRWDKLQVIAPFVTAVVVAVIGYILNYSVNQGFQRSQLQFNYVKEMQELLAKLGDSKTTPEEAMTTAVALAAFGSYSIPPLLNEIQSGQTNRQMAGEYGLQAVALADPKDACPALGRVLENRTAAYNWFTHRAGIRIIGSANCQTMRSVIAQYQARLSTAASSADAFTAFQATLAHEPAVTKETVDQLKSETDKTLNLLDQGSQQ